MLSKMIDRAKSALPVAAPVSEAELKKVSERLTDTRPTTRIGLLLLALVFGAFVVWAFVAPLDEGVPAPGMITVESKRKIVQHLTGGIIKAVLVKEAQEVQAGADQGVQLLVGHQIKLLSSDRFFLHDIAPAANGIVRHATLGGDDVG